MSVETAHRGLEEPLQYAPMSWEDYCDLPDRPRAEWVDGVAILMAPPRQVHQLVAGRLRSLLEVSLPEAYALPEAGVRMVRSARVPDVLVVRALDDGGTGWGTSIPVLAGEVLSPSTRGEDMLRKTHEYARHGIEQYWIIDVEAWRMDVLALTGDIYEPVATLDAKHPVQDLPVGDYGTVHVDLEALLRV